MIIIAQIGEMPDRVRQFAECDGHRVEASRSDAGLDLARVLVKEGYDPAAAYETRRGTRLAMRYASLGHAASLTIEERKDGKRLPRFVRWTSRSFSEDKNDAEPD